MSKSRLLRFVCLALGWLAIASSVSAQSTAKPLTVLTGIQLRELRLSDSTPDQFRANFIIWFSWEPQPGQNWSANKVNFTNAIGDPAIKVAIWTKPDPQLPRQRFQAMIYEGEFKAFNRYEAFPADKHLLAIRIVCPKVSCGQVNFISKPERITLDSSIPHVLSDWKITGTGFATQQVKLPEDLNLEPSDQSLRLPSAETTINGFVIRVERDLIPGLLRIFIPILLIWLLAYVGFFWEDSSPASRFGATALFVAIAFNLATRSIQPAVSYITLMDLTFLSLYINILLIVFFITLSFYFRPRKKNHERIANLGKWLSPVILILTIILLIPAARIGQATYSEASENMQFKEWQP